MNSEAINLLISKHPKLKRARAKLEAMQPGALCIHRSWGIGEIKDYNELENKLVIDFEEGERTGHSMDPAFCVDKLDILDSSSIIVRQRTEPDVVGEMIKKTPTDVIVEILKETEGNSATNSEIERQLSRILGSTKYKKWWTATKKQLVKDPRIAVPVKKTDPYILREEPIKAEEEILEQFYLNKSIKKQIELADKLLALSVEHEDIKEQLPDILQVLTKGLKESKQLNQGERLHGIWIRNDLARFIHKDPEVLAPTSQSIIEEEANELSALSELLPASMLKRFLALIHRCLSDDWEKIIFDLLRNSSGKFTNECIAFLMDKDCGPRLQETLNRWLDEQALKEPILFWIVKNRNSRKFSKMLQGMIGPRLFSALLYAIDYEALQNASTRRIALADFLSDDIEIIPELLAEATPETARDLATMLMLNQGFEGLTKRSILARFIRLFPSVQSLVTGDDSGVEEQSDDLIVSIPSFEARKEEYDVLIKEKIPENKKAIATAREHGDLKENSEYKMARQDQDMLLARKSLLEEELGRAQQTDFSNAPSDSVGVGTVVDLHVQSTDSAVTYSILGAWDSKPEENILSYKTPLAQVLLSKKVGDSVTTEIGGVEEVWTVKKITRYLDVVKE